MRIVFVCDSWRSVRGGIQTVNRELASAIAEGDQVEHVLCITPSPTPEEVSIAKGSGVRLLRGGQHYFDAVDLLRQIQPEFVVGHSYFTGPAAEALAKICGSRWIQVVHVDPEDNESWKEYRSDRVGERISRSKAELDLCLRAYGVICIGPRLFRDFNTRLLATGNPQKPLLRVDCGMNPLRPRPLPDTLEIIAMGRSDSVKVKGLDIIALAAGLVCKNMGNKRTQLRFRIRGATHTADALEKKLQDLSSRYYPDILAPIHVLPYIPDETSLENDLFRSRILLMPSRAEAYGLVAFEAISRGIPVLVSDQSGAAELIQEMSYGQESVLKFILPVAQNPQSVAPAWANMICEILRQPEVFEKVASDLGHRLYNKASWAVAAQCVTDFFTSLLSSESFGFQKSPQMNQIVDSPTLELFDSFPLEYLESLTQQRAEDFSLSRLAGESYKLGRAAANEGRWDDAYRHHLIALAIWRKLEEAPRISRSLGRLAWCLLAKGQVKKALDRLHEAEQLDPVQGAANVFWAAQYCFRAGMDQEAEELLCTFVRIVLKHGLANISSNELFSDLGPLKLIESFYENTIATEEKLGWGNTGWSDRGRLSLVRAALDEQNQAFHLLQAKEEFSKCGLTSYVQFIEGKLSLNTLKATVNISSSERIQLLQSMNKSFEQVVQRFDRQESILEGYRLIIQAEIALAELELECNQDFSVATLSISLNAIYSTLDSLSEALGPKVANEVGQLRELLGEYVTMGNKITVNSMVILFNQAYEMFRKINKAMPDLEGYYLPTLTKVLGHEILTGMKGESSI